MDDIRFLTDTGVFSNFSLALVVIEESVDGRETGSLVTNGNECCRLISFAWGNFVCRMGRLA